MAGGYRALRIRASVFLATPILALAAACAHAPLAGRDPARVLAERICALGGSSAQGSVWVHAQSRDASGRFPADAKAEAPGQLVLVVTNLLGGTEGLVRVENGGYRVEAKGRAQEGRESWAGIPLRWSVDLFLGRIPCPEPGDRASARRVGEDQIEVMSRQGTFTYRIDTYDGIPWADQLTWSEGEKRVEFEFQDPDPVTRSPRRWLARSAEGTVTVGWREYSIR